MHCNCENKLVRYSNIMAGGSGNERSRQKYSVSEVLSLLHLDDTQSGSDLDNDEFNNSATESDTENTNIDCYIYGHIRW